MNTLFIVYRKNDQIDKRELEVSQLCRDWRRQLQELEAPLPASEKTVSRA